MEMYNFDFFGNCVDYDVLPIVKEKDYFVEFRYYINQGCFWGVYAFKIPGLEVQNEPGYVSKTAWYVSLDHMSFILSKSLIIEFEKVLHDLDRDEGLNLSDSLVIKMMINGLEDTAKKYYSTEEYYKKVLNIGNMEAAGADNVIDYDEIRKELTA